MNVFIIPPSRCRKGDNSSAEISSYMVMAGGIIGGLTCSDCTNCEIEYTTIIAAPGGNSGILGGGFSKPALENCSVRHCTIQADLGPVEMFGMMEDSWIGGLTGSGGSELEDVDSPRMLIQGCTVQDVEINLEDAISCVGGLIGGGLSEGEPPHSFLVDGCHLDGVVITTDAPDLEASLTGLLIGQSLNSQVVSMDGEIVDITDRNMDAESINSIIDVQIIHQNGSPFEDPTLIGQVTDMNEILTQLES